MNQNKSNQNYNMGLQYQFGMNGLEKDYNKALFYYEKASKENFKSAQEKVYYNQLPLSIYTFFIGILLIFLVVGIVTNNIWIIPFFPGIIYASYTTFNLNNYWNKEGLTYKINITLLMISYLILIPLAAVIPYLYGISWFPITFLLLIGIVIVGVGLIQLFDDRNKINTTIFLSGLFVVGVSIFGLSIDTSSQQFIIRDFENGVEIVSYRSNELDLVIPDTINNKPVLKIGKRAFSNTSIKSIELPSSLRFIDDYAFSYARSLKAIDLRGNIQLGKGVFLYAVSLETVYLPVDMTVLPEEMLMGTFSLKELKLPDTLLSIENGALSYSGLNDIYLPTNLKNIGDNALRGTQITEITLPNHLENIGDYVLAENQALQNIQFSTNMSTIPKGMFQDTKNLTYIMIPTHITEIHEAAFKNSEGLLEISLHNELILIEDEAFMNTKSLESITIPSSIDTIHKRVFQGSENLKNIQLPNHLISIKDYAFSGLTQLTDINLPEGLDQIGTAAFSNNVNLKEIHLPETVTTLGNAIFSNNHSLELITLPPSLKRIGNHFCYNCHSLKTILFPTTLTSIGERAFYQADLKNINLPNNLSVIEEYAFYGNANNESIRFSSNLKIIEDYAFYGNSQVKSIILPESLEQIEDGAFSLCRGATEIVLNSNITYVGNFAFYQCGEAILYLANSLNTNDWHPNWNPDSLVIEDLINFPNLD